MMDKVGYLEVGRDERGDIVVNHPDLSREGVGHIVFSPNQARHLATLLLKNAAESEFELRRKAEDAQRKKAEAIPVDRSAQVLTDGSEVTEDHREIISGGVRAGQQKSYVVLSAEERAKGFVRPLRDTYLHKACKTTTTMGSSIAETYARDPAFYNATFCANCKTHFPLDQFVWKGTDEQVGS